MAIKKKNKRVEDEELTSKRNRKNKAVEKDEDLAEFDEEDEEDKEEEAPKKKGGGKKPAKGKRVVEEDEEEDEDESGEEEDEEDEDESDEEEDEAPKKKGKKRSPEELAELIAGLGVKAEGAVRFSHEILLNMIGTDKVSSRYILNLANCLAEYKLILIDMTDEDEVVIATGKWYRSIKPIKAAAVKKHFV